MVFWVYFGLVLSILGMFGSGVLGVWGRIMGISDTLDTFIYHGDLKYVYYYEWELIQFPTHKIPINYKFVIIPCIKIYERNLQRSHLLKLFMSIKYSGHARLRAAGHVCFDRVGAHARLPKCLYYLKPRLDLPYLRYVQISIVVREHYNLHKSLLHHVIGEIHVCAWVASEFSSWWWFQACVCCGVWVL